MSGWAADTADAQQIRNQIKTQIIEQGTLWDL